MTIKRTREDIAFSKMIRARDGYTCQRCGAKHTPTSQGLHAAHMFTRACKVCTAKRPRGAPVREHACTRLDPDNAVAACYGCHQFLDSHPAAKIEFFEKHLGLERFENLAARAHGKRDRSEL